MKVDRVELSDEILNIGELYEWALAPECGAVVVFSGTVRDHADGRTGVTSLSYESYRDVALKKMNEIVAEARHRFKMVGKIAIAHRLGTLALTESSVVVVVSAPHRPEAFDAARFCIDALKQSVPIWKKEEWAEGSDWGTGAHSPIPVSQVAQHATGSSR